MRELLSSERMGVLCALLAFAVLGYALWAISAYIPVHQDQMLASTIMAQPKFHLIAPKPRDQFVYMALVLATPFVVLPIARAAQAQKPGGAHAHLALTLGALAAGAIILVRDPVAGYLHPGWPAVALAAIAGLGVARIEHLYERPARWLVWLFLVPFTIAITYSYRTFNAVSALGAVSHVTSLQSSIRLFRRPMGKPAR
ncbi:MAG: hypothetical protein WDN45_05630 [Caulobacteraceae bacterium]